jgi:hypothetical protein
MGALDKRLYTSHHTPTDTVARVGPACVKLALNGCSYLQSTARLSLQRDRTYNPHPCTVLTAAHNIHTRPPDAPARLAYQRTLMNSYCMFDRADLASARAKVAAFSRSHAAGPASTSLVPDATTCPTRKSFRLLQQPAVAPILAELAQRTEFCPLQDPCARANRRTTRDPDRHGPARGDARRFARPQAETPNRAAV